MQKSIGFLVFNPSCLFLEFCLCVQIGHEALRNEANLSFEFLDIGDAAAGNSEGSYSPFQWLIFLCLFSYIYMYN